MKTLKDAKVGETVKATKLTGEGPVKRRIMDMGITKGVEIYVRKVAPLGDPKVYCASDSLFYKIYLLQRFKTIYGGFKAGLQS